MSDRRRFASVLVVIVLAAIFLMSSTFTRTPDGRSATVVVDGGSAQQRAMIEWALELFEAAGLPLPGIDIRFENDRSACFGRAGSATPDGDRTQIRLCTADAGPVQEWLILHELAHAWDQHVSEDERRAAFLEARGLSEWRAGEWHVRGAEQAAEIIVWGLMDRPVALVRFDQNSCGELRAGYVALTGQAPLHGFEDLC